MKIVLAVANKYDSESNIEYITEMLSKGWKVLKIGFLFNVLQKTEPTQCEVKCVLRKERKAANPLLKKKSLIYTIDVSKYSYIILSKKTNDASNQMESDFEPFIGHKLYLVSNIMIIMALVLNIPNVLLYFMTMEWFPTNILFFMTTFFIIADTIDLFVRIKNGKKISMDCKRIIWYRIMRIFVPFLTIVSLAINFTFFMT